MTSEPAARPGTAGAARALRLRPAQLAHALPWVLALGYFLWPGADLNFGTQVMIWILFALSLDLALGYAGILTLGHSAFLGLGAYGAGLFAIHLSPDPLLGHLASISLCALFGSSPAR